VASSGQGAKRRAPSPEVEELVAQLVKKKLHMLKSKGRTKCNKKVTMLYAKYLGDGPRADKMDFCDMCLAA
jgi:hypothetical protein